MSLAMRFEREAVFIDSKYAEKGDVTFLWLIKGMRWIAADATLFDGLDYVKEDARDHFFTDELRDICAAIVGDDQSEVGLAHFVELAKLDTGRRRPVVHWDRGASSAAGTGRLVTIDGGRDQLRPALDFFNGITRNEKDRLRWDRLVAFHLLVMAFLAEFGYEPQRLKGEHYNSFVRNIEHPEVARNLRLMLDKLMVAGSTRDLCRSLDRVAPPPSPSDAAQAAPTT